MSKGTITRERIVDQALKDASLEGLEGLSLGRLADEVGMSKSGLFAHFGSKEELQKQVLAAAAERFTAIVVRPALTAPRGLPRVRAMFEGWLRWERDESVPGGCVFTHAQAELDDKPGPVRDALAAWQRQWKEMLAK
ncbi:MAG TPA: TetR/AcrR family transcriptional regulator, partial [Gemmatimonadales bacterium]|nr:TetR/AcrR family transcriptional regulator [Gemmatimonadales bacterium]